MRLKALEHVQVGKIRFGFIQVIEILTAPAKGLTFGMFDASSVDPPLLKNIFMLGREILAHYRDNANLREITGRQGEECTGTAQHIFRPSRRRDNGIESNRTNGEDTH